MKQLLKVFGFLSVLFMLQNSSHGQSRINADNLDAVTNMMFGFGTRMLTANDNPYQEVE